MIPRMNSRTRLLVISAMAICNRNLRRVCRPPLTFDGYRSISEVISFVVF
jgi:hypothetical protein